jgi:hypothetical protein
MRIPGTGSFSTHDVTVLELSLPDEALAKLGPRPRHESRLIIVLVLVLD